MAALALCGPTQAIVLALCGLMHTEPTLRPVHHPPLRQAMAILGLLLAIPSMETAPGHQAMEMDTMEGLEVHPLLDQVQVGE